MAGTVTEVWNAPGHGFGDLWSAVHWLLRRSTKERTPQFISKYVGHEVGPDLSPRLLEMLSIIKIPEGASLSVSEDVANSDMHMDSFQERYFPTVITWKPNRSRVIAYQFDGVSSMHLKAASAEEQQALTTWAVNTGVALFRVGLPLTMAGNMRILSQAEAFVGIDSGMSHLAHSVGTPVMLLEYQLACAWWHGRNDFTICKGVADFIKRFEELGK